MKILVAGSNGFIGSFLCKSLMKDGISVRGFDSQCNQGQPGSFECFTGDIRHRDIVSKAVKSIDVVVHLIAMHHDFGISESEYFDVNEKGTQNLLTCCSEAGIKKFIFFSSVAVYGTQTKPTNENTTPNPDTPYGSSKLAAEKVVMQWFKAEFGKSTIVSGLLAVVIVSVICYLAIVQVPIPDVLVAACSGVIAFFFGAKQGARTGYSDAMHDIDRDQNGGKRGDI